MTADSDHVARAAALFESGDHRKAEELCRRILSTAPTHTQARVMLGRTLQASGKPEQAQAEYRAVINADPMITDAWRRWAELLQAYGHNEQAAVCLREALSHAPRAWDLHNDLGLVLLTLGSTEEAARHLEQAVEISPSSIAALNNLGIARKAQGRFDAAVASYRRALEIAPQTAELHNNLGDTLKMTDLAAAKVAFMAALRLRPDYPEALDSLGFVLFCENKLEDALAQFTRAVDLQPGFTRALAHKLTTLFLLGRLPEAWALNRRRFEISGIKGDPYGRLKPPVWTGTSLSGKSLVVWTELGLGEEILQASMFNDARAAAARVVVECSPRVRTLFERSFPDIAFIPRVNPSRPSEGAAGDYQIAAGDMGTFFRADFGAFPKHQGYLKADPQKTEMLRRKYHAQGACVVGLSWASYNADLGAQKTLSLRDFAPILRVPNVVFVNVQYQSTPAEVEAVEKALGVRIITDETIDPAGDLDDVAAQVAALDLVISVSNTTVHLAGALNVPVWNIVPAYNGSGMWHWFHDIENSPWYPAMTIYRRRTATPGPLLEKIADDLQHFAERSKD